MGDLVVHSRFFSDKHRGNAADVTCVCGHRFIYELNSYKDVEIESVKFQCPTCIKKHRDREYLKKLQLSIFTVFYGSNEIILDARM